MMDINQMTSAMNQSMVANLANQASSVTERYTLEEFVANHPGKVMQSYQKRTDSNGESFQVDGLSFGASKCFVAFSKKVMDQFPGQNGLSIARSVASKPTDYQVIAKPGVTWSDGSPIYSLCPNNSATVEVEEVQFNF